MAQENLAGGSSARRDGSQDSSWKQMTPGRLCVGYCTNRHECPFRKRLTYGEVRELLQVARRNALERIEGYCLRRFDTTVRSNTFLYAYHAAETLLHDDRLARLLAKKEGVLDRVPLLEETKDLVPMTFAHFKRILDMLDMCGKHGTRDRAGSLLAKDAESAYISALSTTEICLGVIDQLFDAIAAKYAR